MIEAHYMQAIMKEIILLSFLRHSNICHLLGAVRVVGGSSVALVLPWMQHSNVTEYLSTSGEQRIASIMHFKWRADFVISTAKISSTVTNIMQTF